MGENRCQILARCKNVLEKVFSLSEQAIVAMPLETGNWHWLKKQLEGSALEFLGILLVMFGGGYSLGILSGWHSTSSVIGGLALLTVGLGILWYGNQLVRKNKRVPRTKEALGGHDLPVDRFARWLGKEVARSGGLNSSTPVAKPMRSCRFCNATLQGNLAFCSACGKAQV
jgi:hypothetical protein